MIALFGGSFDPVHLGHLRIAEDIREHFSLEKVVFVPAYLSPLKSSHSASAEDRFQMLRLATKDNPYFDVSRFEIDKGKVSYTVDTATYYVKLLGYKPGFIIGSDAFLCLSNWKSPDILLESLNFIVTLRGEDSLKDLEKFAESLGKRVNMGRRIEFRDSGIYVYMCRKIDVSSTEIRQKVAKGRSIKYLVVPDVEEYIHKKGLYRGI